MDEQHARDLAKLLADARREGRQIADFPKHLVPPAYDDGYRVNALVADALGWPLLGWKIAATSTVMQQRLRATAPLYGRTFTRFEMQSPARLRHAELLDPLVECEFFFRLAKPLPPRAQPYVMADVADAVSSVHAGIEVAECRFPLAALPPVPAILADGAASGRYVIGGEIADWRSRNLAEIPVTLTVDGSVRRSGSGREVMNHPLNPVVWLANERSRWGDGLSAGTLISSGTTTGMLLAKAGERMAADFGGIARVEVAFD